MGILSGIQRFHSAGQDPSETDVEKYGRPACTLYTELNPGDLHQKIEIKDEQGQTLYYTKSSVFALKGKTDIFDASGAPAAHLEKKPISLHEKHYITMADGQKFTMSNELFHVFKDVTNIEGLGWQLQGNVIGLNFMLFDRNGEAIAAIGQKMISIHNRCSIDLYQPKHEKDCGGHRDPAAENAHGPPGEQQLIPCRWRGGNCNKRFLERKFETS